MPFFEDIHTLIDVRIGDLIYIYAYIHALYIDTFIDILIDAQLSLLSLNEYCSGL